MLTVPITITHNNATQFLFTWLQPDEIAWHKYETIFVTAFSMVFQDFSAHELDIKQSDKPSGIAAWFKDEVTYEMDFAKEAATDSAKAFYFLAVTHQNQPIGYAIWHWSAITPTQIYQSSICLLPTWQHQGIGTRMVNAIKTQLPNLQFFFANTRKDPKNKTNLFYKHRLHCAACAIVPDPTLDAPEKFTGYKGFYR